MKGVRRRHPGRGTWMPLAALRLPAAWERGPRRKFPEQWGTSRNDGAGTGRGWQPMCGERRPPLKGVRGAATETRRRRTTEARRLPARRGSLPARRGSLPATEQSLPVVYSARFRPNRPPTELSEKLTDSRLKQPLARLPLWLCFHLRGDRFCFIRHVPWRKTG